MNLTELLKKLLEEVTDDIGRTYADQSEVQGYLNMHPIPETIKEYLPHLEKELLKVIPSNPHSKRAIERRDEEMPLSKRLKLVDIGKGYNSALTDVEQAIHKFIWGNHE